MQIKRAIILSLLALFLLAGCQTDTSSQRLIVSHTWEGDDADVLEAILASFAADNPDLTLTVERGGETAVSVFERQAEAGLGADVLIGLTSPDMVGLYKSGLTIDLAPLNGEDLVDMRLRRNVKIDGKLLGIPLSATTSVVYYDAQQIETPPQTLDDLIEIADKGQMVAININPLISLWGINAFGGQFYDAQNNVALNTNDAYAQWLTWLQTASLHPNIVLNDDYDTLLAQFSSAEFGVLVGQSADYPSLINIMGEDLVGITTLPENTGSVLLLETIVINRSSANKDIAMELIQFLLNDTQQRTLAIANIGYTAASLNETLDNRLFNYASTLQSLVAISEPMPLSNGPTTGFIIETMSLLNSQLLDGILDPTEAAEKLQQEIQTFQSQPQPE